MAHTWSSALHGRATLPMSMNMELVHYMVARHCPCRVAGQRAQPGTLRRRHATYGPHSWTPPSVIILDQFELDLSNVQTYQIHAQNRAYSLQLEFRKFITSDFWGWGLSAWPLRPTNVGRTLLRVGRYVHYMSSRFCVEASFRYRCF